MTVVDGSLVACAIVLLTFGELGYMVYGDATNDMVRLWCISRAALTCVLTDHAEHERCHRANCRWLADGQLDFHLSNSGIKTPL